MTAGADKGNLSHIFVHLIRQYPVRLYMAVSMLFQITSEGIVMISSFKGEAVDKFSYNSLKFLHVLIAGLLNSLDVLFELSAIAGFQHPYMPSFLNISSAS